MSSKLSIDILSIIFEYLEQENYKALYSCIFVNRKWCRVAIPFLWKNPWKKWKFYGYGRENQYKILFKCFLMMIPKESKEFLKMNGINLLIEDFPQNNSSSLQTSLFNYASFIKVIDSSKINDLIIHNLVTSITDNHLYLVQQEILKLLIGNTSKLKILILYHKSHPIANFPNSFVSLSQLNELHCDTSINPTIFHGLSQLCRNIERLVIEGYNDDNHGLILFIKQQINLKKVKIWEDDYGMGWYFAQGQCKNLGEALATKTSSIIELDLGECVITIPPILLKQFQNNLTIFKFCICYECIDDTLGEELENVLKDISLPNLQQLIVYNYCTSTIIEKIITKTNGQLKKINVKTVHYEENDMLIPTIAKHCHKLELLAVNTYHSSEILELIKECKKLSGLVLRSVYNEQNIGELFKILYNDASNQLRKLQFDNDWEISKEKLNEFFENWNQKQRNSLDFYISSNAYKNEYEDIIKKYQELGVIRKFDKYTGNHYFLGSLE